MTSAQDMKVLDDTIEGPRLSEQRENSALSDAKAQIGRLERENAASVSELEGTCKNEEPCLELKLSTEMKDHRAESEAKIKRLEHDIAAAMSKNDQMNQDMIKAMDQHNRQCEELNIKLETVQEKLEGEKREIVREAQQKQHELQSENEELRSENKRLENDKMMEQKDHDTERTLLKSHISNLEKQLKDREMVLRDCQESKEAELQEAKLKLQGMKAEDEAKLNKEREDSRQKLEEMKVKYEEKIREFKEEINVKQTDLKVLEERIEGLKLSEQRANSALSDAKARMHEQKEQYNATVKELKESNQTLQKELQDEKSNHQMTQLRAEKQEEWNRRELAQHKDELDDMKKLRDNMISRERDVESLQKQNQTALAYTLSERDSENAKLENAKRKLDEELARMREQLRKAQSDGAQTQTLQKELAKLERDKDRATRELVDCRNDLEAARKTARAKEEEVHRKEADLRQDRERMKLVLLERDDIKKERDGLEVEAMRLEMVVKNIQQIEERKYQFEIQRLLAENEKLKRADPNQMTDSGQKGSEGAPLRSAMDDLVPPLTAALARIRGRSAISAPLLYHS
mmetsp:Transcript_36749/g.76739  ORF Transcript_36749/g.76739 Transcript_36749/m.76739 type:complete len:576 (-) Transcript_36749:238-1965(-)